MTRALPDPDLVVLDAIRDHLRRDDVTVLPLRPVDWLSLLPLVTARTVTPPDSTQMLRFRYFVEPDIQCWASTRQAASDLHDAVAAALLSSRSSTYHGGRIGRVENPLGGEARTADMPDDVWRWQSSPRLTIRVAA